MAKLLVQESNGAREFELVDLEVNIGRELDNTLRLADPSISRHHAVVRLGPSGYEIQDLDSSNGVLLNGIKVPSALLHDGDRITLGQMQLTFVDPHPAQLGNPLGTVRMTPEDLAGLRSGSAELPPDQPPPAAPEPPMAEAPAPDPSGPLPGGGFLRRYLPRVPDDAVPLQLADGSIERGDFITRLLATLIDYAPLLALALLSTGVAAACQPGYGGATGPSYLFSFFRLLRLVLLVGYLVLMPLWWMQYAASPGKKIMRLRLVPEANPAGRLDLSASVLRLLGYLVNAIITWIIMFPATTTLLAAGGPCIHLAGLLVAAILPYLTILGRNRKGLEDWFSRSMVMKVDR